MAARKDTKRPMWPFYVYELEIGGVVVYVGKGSGGRLAAQTRRIGREGGTGREVARFKQEDAAYSFEMDRIAEMRPARNKHPGGQGGRFGARQAEDLVMRSIRVMGTKRYAANCILRHLRLVPGMFSASELEQIRIVAHG